MAAAFHVVNGEFVSVPEPVREEVEFSVALHLEAYTDETEQELFIRACQTLRAAGIRVKAGWSPNPSTHREAAEALASVLYPEDECEDHGTTGRCRYCLEG